MATAITRVERSILTTAVHAVLFLFCMLLVINGGFILHATINEWTLPASFIAYTTGALAFHAWRAKWRPAKIAGVAAAAFILPVAFFWAGTQIFNNTFDAGWDGQNYHATGILGLAEGWNPVYQDDVPLDVANHEGGTIGSPKALWEIQAAIYKVAKPLEVVFMTNVYITVCALVMAFTALVALGIKRWWAAPIALLFITAPQPLQQFFSFMSDGFSYELSIVAAASLALLAKNIVPRAMCTLFISVIIFLMGIKLSNAYIVLPLTALFGVLVYRCGYYKQRWAYIVAATAVAATTILLWAPYATNVLRHGSPIYPFNEPDHRGSMTYQGVPINIHNASQIQLFYYGIFSKTVGGQAHSEENNAVVKIPFSVHESELKALESSREHLLGGEGVLFSGVLLSALLAFIMLLSWEKSVRDRALVRYTAITLGLILAGTLMNSIPNNVRYVGQLWWLPLIIIVTLLLLQDAKTRKVRLWFAGGLLALSGVNMLISASFTIQGRLRENAEITQQITNLKQSGKTYQVRLGYFYSHLVRLSERGVPVERVDTITCKQPVKLAYSWNTTSLCEK